MKHSISHANFAGKRSELWSFDAADSITKSIAAVEAEPDSLPDAVRPFVSSSVGTWMGAAIGARMGTGTWMQMMDVMKMTMKWRRPRLKMNDEIDDDENVPTSSDRVPTRAQLDQYLRVNK